MVVVRSSPSGSCISSGEVCLPKGGSLLLDGHGAHFTDICFSGTSYSCTTASLHGNLLGFGYVAARVAVLEHLSPACKAGAV